LPHVLCGSAKGTEVGRNLQVLALKEHTHYYLYIAIKKHTFELWSTKGIIRSYNITGTLLKVQQIS
jgi:hypothetical protein